MTKPDTNYSKRKADFAFVLIALAVLCGLVAPWVSNMAIGGKLGLNGLLLAVTGIAYWIAAQDW